MAAGFQFRIDQIPINLDLKSSPGGFYQLDIRDKIWILFFKSGFQTESSRMVVSRHTKFNGYLIHKKSPLESVSKKYNTRVFPESFAPGTKKAPRNPARGLIFKIYSICRIYIYKNSLNHSAITVITPEISIIFTGEEGDPITLLMFKDGFGSKW